MLAAHLSGGICSKHWSRSVWMSMLSPSVV